MPTLEEQVNAMKRHAEAIIGTANVILSTPAPEPAPTEPTPTPTEPNEPAPTEPTPTEPIPDEPVPLPEPVPVPTPTPTPPAPPPAPTPIPGRLTSVQEVIDHIKTKRGADAILAPGSYPALVLAGLGSGAMTRIIADPDTVTFKTVDIRGSSNITFQDVIACPDQDSRPLMVKNMHPPIVKGDVASTDIHWIGGKIMSRRDGLNYLNFAKDQIQSAEWFGINLAGDKCRVEGVHVFAVWKAISVGGDFSQVLYNSMEGLTCDGVNWTGNDALIEGNDCWNFLQVSADHKDGGQTWPKSGGTILRTTYRHNRIVDWQADPMHSFRATAQGFNGHNGPHDGMTIEDNEAWVASAWGANWSATTNSSIQRNRVFYTDGPVNIRPDISMFPNSGNPVNPALHPVINVAGRNNVVANNVAPAVRMSGTNITGQNGNRKPDYTTDIRPVLKAG